MNIAAARCTAKWPMDDHWATVGSSNLDPLSLSLNLEANLIIHDRQFNQTLRDNLQGLDQ